MSPTSNSVRRVWVIHVRRHSRGARLTVADTTQPGVGRRRSLLPAEALVGIEGRSGLAEWIGSWIVLSTGGIP